MPGFTKSRASSPEERFLEDAGYRLVANAVLRRAHGWTCQVVGPVEGTTMLVGVEWVWPGGFRVIDASLLLADASSELGRAFAGSGDAPVELGNGLDGISSRPPAVGV
jgi:hypothetical protein